MESKKRTSCSKIALWNVSGENTRITQHFVVEFSCSHSFFFFARREKSNRYECSFFSQDESGWIGCWWFHRPTINVERRNELVGHFEDVAFLCVHFEFKWIGWWWLLYANCNWPQALATSKWQLVAKKEFNDLSHKTCVYFIQFSNFIFQLWTIRIIAFQDSVKRIRS